MATAAELKAAGPPVASGAVDGPAPIGVPSGYSATRRDPFQIDGPVPGTSIGGPISGTAASYQLAAQYHDGDQYSLSSMDPVALSQLQATMRNAGLLDDDYVSGYGDDPATVSGYTQLLAEANQSGYTWQQQLQRRLAQPKVTKAKKTAGFVAQPFLKPDPATIRESARALAKQVLGPHRVLSDEEANQLVGAAEGFARQEYDAQTAAQASDFAANQAAADAGDGTGGGGAVVQSVDPSARFAEYFNNRYKPEINMGAERQDLADNRDGLLGSVFAIDQAISSPGL